jgi:hypothetical protein
MKMHKSVIDKLIYLCQTFGGYEHEHKLRAKFNDLDMTPYERKEINTGETILVLTDDYIRELEGKKR